MNRKIYTKMYSKVPLYTTTLNYYANYSMYRTNVQNEMYRTNVQESWSQKWIGKMFRKMYWKNVQENVQEKFLYIGK